MINSFTESYFTPRSTVALLRTYTGATTDRVLVLSIVILRILRQRNRILSFPVFLIPRHDCTSRLYCTLYIYVYCTLAEGLSTTVTTLDFWPQTTSNRVHECVSRKYFLCTRRHTGGRWPLHFCLPAPPRSRPVALAPRPHAAARRLRATYLTRPLRPPDPDHMKLFYGMVVLHILMEGIGGIVACARPEVFEGVPLHSDVARNHPHNMRCVGILLLLVALVGAVLVADPHASNAKQLLALCSCFHLSAIWMLAAAPSGADLGGASIHGSVGLTFAYLAATHQPSAAAAVAGSKDK